MTLHVQPLRDMVLVRPIEVKSPSGLQVIREERAICRFYVVAIGPEVRDVHTGDTVLANRLAGTSIGDELLMPESAIIAHV